jgi:hypothetical protein
MATTCEGISAGPIFTSACFAPNYYPHIYSAALKFARHSLRCITRSQSRGRGRLPFESCQSRSLAFQMSLVRRLRTSCALPAVGRKTAAPPTVLSLPSVIRAASNACATGDYFSARARMHRFIGLAEILLISLPAAL